MIENARGLPERLSIKQAILIIAGLVLITAAVRIPLLGIPFERDEGEYAYIAWRLGHNELPYRDWVDQKPPAIFWIYRAALALPGDPIRAVHFVALVFSTASACALFFLAHRFLNRFWAFGAAALFVLLSADPWIEGTAANTEIFMLLPLILAQIAFFKSIENARPTMSILLCGALTGIAVMFKQVAAVNWILLAAVFPIVAPPNTRWRTTFRFAILSAGGALGIAGCVLIYFWIQQGLGALIENVFTHNLEYIGAMTWSDRFRFCADTLARLAPAELVVWVFAFAGLIALIARRKGKWLAFLGGWWITSAVGISASGYFFPHYFQQWLPPVALLALFGAAWLSELDFWKYRWLPMSIFSLVLAGLPLKTLWPFWFSYPSTEAIRKIYPGNFFAEMPALGDRISKVTAPDQRVFIFGAEPELLFYAHRVSASRYIFLFPLYGPYRDAREKQLAAAEEIDRKVPAAAVYVPNQLFFTSGTEQFFTNWSLYYIDQNFLPDTWLINDSPATARLVLAGSSPPPEQFIGAIFVRK